MCTIIKYYFLMEGYGFIKFFIIYHEGIDVVQLYTTVLLWYISVLTDSATYLFIIIVSLALNSYTSPIKLL